MNKREIINEVAKLVDKINKAQTVVDTIFSQIEGVLKKKDTFTILGFGSI